MKRVTGITALFVALLVGSAFAVSAPQLYVGNYSGAGILSWPPSATGNIAPSTSITGATTTLSGPSGVAIDASGNVWVGDYNNNKILKFNAGTTGNIAPAVTITPPAGSAHPRWLAFDSNGYLYVADSGPSIVYIYSPAQLASTGSPSPNSLNGGSTTIGSLDAIAIDANNKIYVSDNNSTSSAITVDIFAASTAGGGGAPIAQITGASTGFGTAGTDFIDAVAVDASGNVYVANTTLNSITKWSAGSTGNVAPGGTITASINAPRGIAVDATGNIYVSNSGNNSITVYSSAGSLLQTISGASTLLNGTYELTLWNVTAASAGKGFFFAP